MNFTNKIALVTGGSRGIGFEISKILLENGAIVLAVSRNSEHLASAKQLLPDLDTMQCDVSSYSDAERVASKIRGMWDKLDILINNAGVYPDPGLGILGTPDYLLEETFQINVFGTYIYSKKLLPLLLESNEPRILNLGSSSGIMAKGLHGIYGVSKAAIHALTIGMANELGPKIPVNVLSPGWVKTDMAPNAPGNPRESAESAMWILSQPSSVTGKLFHGTTEVDYSSELPWQAKPN